MSEALSTCEKCEDRSADVKCSCGARFCEGCFTTKHIPRNPPHRRAGSSKTEKLWAWICGDVQNYSDPASRAKQFEQDEATKWFGLYIKKSDKSTSGSERVTRLVETPRFTYLIEESMHHKQDSPPRQFPSLISFVGETGAGKSTLIRSLIMNAKQDTDTQDLEAPVAGARSGSSANLPTTGEVNIYADPATFGTKYPRMFIDCEGMLVGEPIAAQHQKEWANHGRSYILTPKDGKEIDRKTAVLEIYPRFLYIFSDVICMVTRNQKTWADSAVKLLEWSLVGAHNTVNQYALPALIIVLNGPSIENETWLSEDQSIATQDFFETVEKEIHVNAKLRAMAQKHGDKTMQDLLLRNFSSIYVHYIPLDGFRNLGNSGHILPQMQRLASRIQTDSKRVQDQRNGTWSLFDGKQYGIVFDYAFKHLATGTDEPFDFSQCREQVIIPLTMEGHFAEFLGRCLHGSVDDNFSAAASILGSCILRNILKYRGSDLLHPFVVFGTELKGTCRRALEQVLNNSLLCDYVHPQAGYRCSNTKAGHAIGHQAAGGSFLAEGNFIEGAFDADKFLALVENKITQTIAAVNERIGSNRTERRIFAAKEHRILLEELPNKTFWKKSFTSKWIDVFNEQFGHITGARLNIRASICYACLFGRPEYTLPCGHVICRGCIREFDETSPTEQYPGLAKHFQCVMCGSNENKIGQWPFVVDYQPDLSGIRVLSLDGGGVRGITQLTVLRRLERLVNLELPFGELFDLMVGTSAGGLIALGLGIHNLSVTECIDRFKTFCQTGFEERPLTKSRWFGWLARLMVASIYKKEPLERSFRRMFGHKQLFGSRANASRVAVTTTVDKDTLLLASYNVGDGKRYLNSNMETWLAARCTSAAPMYFEAADHSGIECRDGGLLANNPIQLALAEAREIWGSNAGYDLVLSIGCRWTLNPQERPISKFVLKQWLSELFTTLLETMNGNKAWEKFHGSIQQPLLDRCHRLNVHFSNTNTEPKLDDVSAVGSMERSAKDMRFMHTTSHEPFAPFRGAVRENKLKVIADSLRASLYFFELDSIIQQDDVSIVKGRICCRLHPDTASYKALLENTKGFQVKNQMFKMPPGKAKQRFSLDVWFQQQASLSYEAIRIDAFVDNYFVAISGCPLTLKMLSDYWDRK